MYSRSLSLNYGCYACGLGTSRLCLDECRKTGRTLFNVTTTAKQRNHHHNHHHHHHHQLCSDESAPYYLLLTCLSKECLQQKINQLRPNPFLAVACYLRAFWRCACSSPSRGCRDPTFMLYSSVEQTGGIRQKWRFRGKAAGERHFLVRTVREKLEEAMTVNASRHGFQCIPYDLRISSSPVGQIGTDLRTKHVVMIPLPGPSSSYHAAALITPSQRGRYYSLEMVGTPSASTDSHLLSTFSAHNRRTRPYHFCQVA